jgi:hypothetical protein
MKKLEFLDFNEIKEGYLADQLMMNGELLILVKECGENLKPMIGHVKALNKTEWSYDVYSLNGINWDMLTDISDYEEFALDGGIRGENADEQDAINDLIDELMIQSQGV